MPFVRPSTIVFRISILSGCLGFPFGLSYLKCVITKKRKKTKGMASGLGPLDKEKIVAKGRKN